MHRRRGTRLFKLVTTLSWPSWRRDSVLSLEVGRTSMTWCRLWAGVMHDSRGCGVSNLGYRGGERGVEILRLEFVRSWCDKILQDRCSLIDCQKVLWSILAMCFGLAWDEICPGRESIPACERPVPPLHFGCSFPHWPFCMGGVSRMKTHSNVQGRKPCWMPTTPAFQEEAFGGRGIIKCVPSQSTIWIMPST